MVDNGGTGSSNTRSSASHASGNAADKYVYTETTFRGAEYINFTFKLYSPHLDFTGHSNLGLEFQYHALGDLYIENWFRRILCNVRHYDR